MKKENGGMGFLDTEHLHDSQIIKTKEKIQTNSTENFKLINIEGKKLVSTLWKQVKDIEKNYNIENNEYGLTLNEYKLNYNEEKKTK